MNKEVLQLFEDYQQARLKFVQGIVDMTSRSQVCFPAAAFSVSM